MPGSDCHERAYGDMDSIIERAIRSAESVYWGGEAVPSYFLIFGPDEIAVFTGATLCWIPDSGDTGWSKPFIRAARRMAGKMLLTPPDLHTNMELRAAVRGPQALCLDLIACPRLIDRAMDDARRIFRELWVAVIEAGQMDARGFCHGAYSIERAAVLQCDFSCMMIPEMFRRWAMPALEEAAAIVEHAVYHWDRPGALAHTETLLQSEGLYALSYVPGSGHGTHLDYIDSFRRCRQAAKRCRSGAASPAEAEKLLEWFVWNT